MRQDGIRHPTVEETHAVLLRRRPQHALLLGCVASGDFDRCKRWACACTKAFRPLVRKDERWVLGAGRSEDEGGKDKRVLDLFTKDSHHRNITELYLCQDMFLPGKYTKTILHNAHYFVAFKNQRDQLAFKNVVVILI